MNKRSLSLPLTAISTIPSLAVASDYSDVGVGTILLMGIYYLFTTPFAWGILVVLVIIPIAVVKYKRRDQFYKKPKL